jgi:hypothetical protein
MFEILTPKPHPLKAVIAKSGFDQVQVAYSLGMAEGYFSRILSGWIKPRPKLAAKLDELLHELQNLKKAA